MNWSETPHFHNSAKVASERQNERKEQKLAKKAQERAVNKS